MRSAIRSLTLPLFLLALTFTLASTLPGCITDPDDKESCSDCPTSVQWDSGVSRCRDTSNGRFTKSCCCDH